MEIKDAAIAAEELDDALTYYRDVHPDFAEALFNEVSRAKKLIVQFPYAWKNYGGDLYGFVVRRYPYTVVHRVSDDADLGPGLRAPQTAPGLLARKIAPEVFFVINIQPEQLQSWCNHFLSACDRLSFPAEAATSSQR